MTEETKLRVVKSQYLMSHPNVYDYRGVVAAVIDLFFTCQVDLSKPVRLAPDELDYHEWVRPTDAHLEQMAFPSNRLAIEYWMSLNC